MSSKSILAFSLLISSFLIYGQEEKARRITEVLCSDSLYGRGYVKNGVNKAAHFLKDEFQKAGLQPYFKNNSYFQTFSMDVNTFPGTVKVKVGKEMLQPGVDYLVDATSGAFEGKLDLIAIDTSVLTKKYPIDSIIAQVIDGEKSGFFIDITGMTPKAAYKAVYTFNTLAINIGPVVYATDQKFTWSVGRKQLKHPILHIKSSKIDENVQLEVQIEAEFVKNFESKNVVGYLPAKKRSNKAETIVFTAHYDHLGGMGTAPETYFPGANDNASGTAMLISMADYFIENPSEYNILFIAFAGEEAGLVGSRYFVENTHLDLSKIKFLLNLDIMGSGEDGITAVNGRIHKKAFKLLQKINTKKQYLSQVKPRGETQNSDHYHFHIADVPSFFIYTMGPNKNYHDVYDTYEELSFDAYDNIVKLLVEFIERI
ncbi:hypothetical protein CW751_01200 [Brumimicrobium salinarum]|uniref:Peptidase M28 domain-containing protein n=1 Tax=Brumimicrobium salinarum TaxID=2058658 RepID=A0A2I0R5Y2_9FLAO|nr:M28 family peptidase [Brumimicrobium salinarum]PKR81983.1 hypothetical protein CW751_01200 [Brumimicrobium salinarum]